MKAWAILGASAQECLSKYLKPSLCRLLSLLHLCPLPPPASDAWRVTRALPYYLPLKLTSQTQFILSFRALTFQGFFSFFIRLQVPQGLRLCFVKNETNITNPNLYHKSCLGLLSEGQGLREASGPIFLLFKWTRGDELNLQETL